MARSERYPPGWLAWSVWGLGALFYLIGFFQRVAPAVMTTELMREFQIGAAALGNLSGFYFYAYVAMQIPTGILADAWGPRRLLTAGCLTAGLGTLAFALGPSLAWANLGRLMIGGSVAVAFVVLIKLASHWFRPRHFALATGLALLVGVLGAVTAGVPLRLMVGAFGWRLVVLVSALLTLGLGSLIWLFVRDDPGERGYQSHAHLLVRDRQNQPRPLAGLRQVLGRRNVWILFLAPSGQVGAVLAFAGLWGVPYLQARFDLGPAQAAAACSALMVAWALGGPLLGGLSDRLGRRKPLYLAGGFCSTLAWAAMIYLPGLPLSWFVALLLLAGFATGSMIIGFAFAKESVPPQLAGTVSGLTNMGVMLGPTILQPAIGWVLDLRWEGPVVAGARVYGLGAFQDAFLLMIAWGLLSCLLLAFSQDTRCRQVD